MNNSNLAKEMQQYLYQCQRQLKENKEAATMQAKQNLIKMGYLNENLEVQPPYNGIKVNEEDFSLGPNEFQYVKTNK